MEVKQQKMKLKTGFHFIVFIVSACFFSCGKFSDNSRETMQTETRRFDRQFFLTADNSDGRLSVNIRIDLPSRFRDAEISKKIRKDIIEHLFGSEFSQHSNRELLRNFANKLYEEYRDTYLPILNSEVHTESGHSFNQEFSLETEILLSDELLFVLGVNMYIYMGGAHGLTTRSFLNYNLQDGSRILEEDIFIENFEPVLTEILRKQLMNDLGISSAQELAEIYWIENIIPNGNFYITNEFIVYVFNPYEIAPYSIGHTEIRIPFEKLNGIKPSKFPTSGTFWEVRK